MKMKACWPVRMSACSAPTSGGLVAVAVSYWMTKFAPGPPSDSLRFTNRSCVPTSYDSYTMVDAKVGYAASRSAKINVAVNNLFDTKVYSYFLMPGRGLSVELVFSL